MVSITSNWVTVLINLILLEVKEINHYDIVRLCVASIIKLHKLHKNEPSFKAQISWQIVQLLKSEATYIVPICDCT